MAIRYIFEGEFLTAREINSMITKFLQGFGKAIAQARTIHTIDTRIKSENPFKQLNFMQFTLLSILFFMSFPISLLISLIVLKFGGTKQLLIAFWHDFLQTLITIILVTVFVGWYILDWLWGMVSGLLT